MQKWGQGSWQACFKKAGSSTESWGQGGVNLRSGARAPWGLVHIGILSLVTVPVNGSPAGQ